MNSLKRQIEDIMSKNSGKIFSINDFYDIGTKNTIKSILHRLSQDEIVIRLIDGLYMKPKYSKILNEYSYPDAAEIAEKLADKFSWTIAPYGETALNYIGLSNQISNEYIYISNGAYREYWYGDKKIIFKHTANRNITLYSKELAILIQAIKTIGENNISNKDIKKLALFASHIKENLKIDTLKLPFWIQKVLRKIWEMNYE
ncbi:Uncharacterised protein [Metamycoplasma arthritidis]|uniref:Abortive infection protein AbiGI n=1 Tax=Metamycoplasma arthritidis (strain 158L3-1) TaxID=243272 RepID=B3PM21_META1|nr:DUF6088 family protein [Metamycoplasma arthritidis]ACF07073.1 conserved hypothetical protein [Metamycoplasma arthritidis 158L3-1]VEU78601.1 Uncharacterised protein [Metamycoplasma arthritidis]